MSESRSLYSSERSIKFWKMHANGNDFVILDLREMDAPSASLCRQIADRNAGIGCDLILGIDHPKTSNSCASYRIWTNTGDESTQCGNGARCIAAWLKKYNPSISPEFFIESPQDKHKVYVQADGYTTLHLCLPIIETLKFNRSQFDSKVFTNCLELRATIAEGVGSVSVGNPHVIIITSDIKNIQLDSVGPKIQELDCISKEANIGFVQISNRTRIISRVFEFGAGETKSCGTGAAAAVAYLVDKGIVDRAVSVVQVGGQTNVVWPDNTSSIQISGKVSFAFEGIFYNGTI